MEGTNNFYPLRRNITKTSTYTSKIRQAFVGNGICTAAYAPSRSTISDVLKQDLNFTVTKRFVCPEESLCAVKLIKTHTTPHHIIFMAGFHHNKAWGNIDERYEIKIRGKCN